MKFNIPKIIRPLEMSEYDEAMEGLTLHVWINPPRGIHSSYWKFQGELLKLSKELEALVEKKSTEKEIEKLNARIEAVNQEVFAWFSNIWSQGKDPETHVSIEDIEHFADEDPAIWGFVTSSTMNMINEHQAKQRKN